MDLVVTNLHREVSDMSDVYRSISGNEDNENNIGPLKVQDSSSYGHPAKKVALNSYWMTKQQIGPLASLTPTKPMFSAAPASPQMLLTCPRQDEQDRPDPNRLRKDSVGMVTLLFEDAARSKASVRILIVEVLVPEDRSVLAKS